MFLAWLAAPSDTAQFAFSFSSLRATSTSSHYALRCMTTPSHSHAPRCAIHTPGPPSSTQYTTWHMLGQALGIGFNVKDPDDENAQTRQSRT